MDGDDSDDLPDISRHPPEPEADKDHHELDNQGPQDDKDQREPDDPGPQHNEEQPAERVRGKQRTDKIVDVNT